MPVAQAPTVQAALATLRQVLEQDVEPDPTTGERQIRRGVAAGVAIRAKAWTSTNRGRFPNQALTLDLDAAQATCPAGQRTPIVAGAATVHFPVTACVPCALRAQCTTATRGGRSISVRPQEALLQTLRDAQQRPDGRVELRARTTVEHSLARVLLIEGGKARYKGLRKNTLATRRVAAVINLQRVARLPVAA